MTFIAKHRDVHGAEPSAVGELGCCRVRRARMGALIEPLELNRPYRQYLAGGSLGIRLSGT